MPFRSFLPAALAAAVISLSLVAGTTAAGAYDCEAEVNSTLQEHGIAQSDVESAKLLRRSPGKSPSSYTYDVQVRLKSCTAGAVVVHMTKYCMVQDVYTTGDCRVGDLPNY
ncbi:MAG TPA: hypothetical protein VIS03_12675 [Kiloniellaceae bacterium]